MSVTFMLSIGVMICGIASSFVMKPDIPFVDGRRGHAQAGRDTLDTSPPLADKR